jgi:hypothetical protein
VSATAIDRLRTRPAGPVTAAGIAGWIAAVLWLDQSVPLGVQHLLGLGTWVLLGLLAVRETPLVRAQIAIVVAFATAIEYTFSPLLEVYVYRFENVPAYVPPGHGLVYLAALAISRSSWLQRNTRAAVTATVLIGGAFAAWGLSPLAPRPDALGAFWFACLLGFLIWGRSRLLYVGAFFVVTALELLGTHWGIWTWQATDPTGLVSIGNPPSGAAGGYGWFDLAAVLGAAALLGWVQRLRQAAVSWPARVASAAAWSRPLVVTADAPASGFEPVTDVTVPPASATIGRNAAMSHGLSSGSAAMSTAPSATRT